MHWGLKPPNTAVSIPNNRSAFWLDKLMLVGIPILQLIRILSASIAPVIVISGVGLLLLSMTNRYSHVIDRARVLVKELDDTTDDTRRHVLIEQVKITYSRARILRLAIILGSASIFCVTVTVLSLFAGQVLGVQVEYVSVPTFGLGLLALLGSLYHFIGDVTVSLRALELEISSYTSVHRP
jgi:hypothetical protein